MPGKSVNGACVERLPKLFAEIGVFLAKNQASLRAEVSDQDSEFLRCSAVEGQSPTPLSRLGLRNPDLEISAITIGKQSRTRRSGRKEENPLILVGLRWRCNPFSLKASEIEALAGRPMPQAVLSSAGLRGGHSQSKVRRDSCEQRGRFRD